MFANFARNIDKLHEYTLRRPLSSFSFSPRPPGLRYHSQFCWWPSRKVPGALQSWFLTYNHRFNYKVLAMPRTTLFKTESFRRQMLEIPVQWGACWENPQVVTCNLMTAIGLVETTGTTARSNLERKISACDWLICVRHLLTLKSTLGAIYMLTLIHVDVFTFV